MARTINEGDRVEVFFVNPEGSQIKGVVMNVPYSTGDLWYIKCDDGSVYAINPNSSNFEYIFKGPPDKG